MPTHFNIDQLLSFTADEEHKYQQSLPPVHLWNPSLSGDIDIRIDREGRWFHEGGEIKRSSMVKMFSSILKREGDEYFLLTPVEKWRIQVDVAPFVIVACRVEGRGAEQCIFVGLNTEQEILISDEHKLWVETDSSGQPKPLVAVRDNMPALIGRNVFYELVELADSKLVSGVEVYGITSAGAYFELGSMA